MKERIHLNFDTKTMEKIDELRKKKSRSQYIESQLTVADQNFNLDNMNFEVKEMKIEIKNLNENLNELISILTHDEKENVSKDNGSNEDDRIPY